MKAKIYAKKSELQWKMQPMKYRPLLEVHFYTDVHFHTYQNLAVAASVLDLVLHQSQAQTSPLASLNVPEGLPRLCLKSNVHNTPLTAVGLQETGRDTRLNKKKKSVYIHTKVFKASKL